MVILLFIADLIALVVLIIKFSKYGIGVLYWCKHLEENPEMMQRILRGPFGEDLTIEALGEGAGLLVRMGPDTVGTIETCSNARSDNDAQLISQWVEDLKV